MKTLYFTTPFSRLRMQFNDTALVGVDFDVSAGSQPASLDPLMAKACQQLRAYADSARSDLDLPVEPAGTEFQQKVWKLLRQIPAGQVRTYGDIAHELGSSPRAVGNACRANPIPLFIPCHRVVSKSGLGGFAGKTKGHYLTIKEALLRHEGVEIPENNPKCIGK